MNPREHPKVQKAFNGLGFALGLAVPDAITNAQHNLLAAVVEALELCPGCRSRLESDREKR